MKRLLLLSFLFVISSVTYAQTQQGRVKTRGRLNSNGTVTPGKGISGATVTLGNGSTQVSGNNGTFSFAASKGMYSLKNVQKQNYQLCDRDLLGRSKKYSTDILEIAMQTSDEALEDRLESEEKIRATLTAQLNKQKAELRNLKEQQQISQQEYNEKLSALYDAQGTNEKFISEMAERYSTMDFDQMDEFQRKVAFYIQNGELARADSLLNTKGSMEERSEEIDRARKANAEEKADIAHRQENLDKSEKQVEMLVEDFGADCYSHSEICFGEHKNDSAAYWLELRANKDSLNIDWQLEAGLFLANILSDYNNAMEYFQIALTSSLSFFGEENTHVATSYANIGSIYFSQGDYGRALEYQTKALEIQKKIFGDEHLDVAVSYTNIGSIYSSQGDYSRALEYQTKALEILKKIFGEEHPRLAVSYNNIGSIYFFQGDYARALEYNTKALEIQKMILGEENPHVALIYNDIAVIYNSLGGYNHALEYHTKALDIRKKIFGDESPHVATSYDNIGNTYFSQGDYVRALEYHTKALDIRKKIFGDVHPDVATCYNYIGNTYFSQGDYVRALEYYTKALEILKKIFGDEHSNVATCYNNIGNIYFSQGDYVRALEYDTKALDILKKLYGGAHQNVAETFMVVHAIYEMVERNMEFEQLINGTLSTMAYTLTCIDGDTPAKQQGMSGEYIVLKFDDWTIQGIMSPINKNNDLRGKPKTIVVMKDGIISEHFFEDMIGVQISCKYVGKEEKQRLIDAYKQWKKIRSVGK